MKEQTTLNIKGMTCEHCQSAVTKALRDLNGVSAVDVDLNEGKATVTYDADKASKEQMKEAIEEQGYDVV